MTNTEHIIKMTDKNTSQIHVLIEQKVDIWLHYVLFSPLWWIAASLTIIPWIFWLLFRPRESTDRLMYAGFFVMIISLVLDVLGDQYGLWFYRFNLIPVLPTYFPWDLTLMPLSIMFLLQIKPQANPLFKALLFAIATSFIGEPFFAWMKVYVLIHWHYYFSAPIQFCIYLVAHYISRRTKFSKLT
ncbi:hypothetical protein G4D61_10940 [Bacillus ginsengihumi]|uniref:Uncharacterized protein n=1 Tax=Heyndrickxia ginsengihumi TaxID=363870 RepID=A0A6M0P7D6_9BACI|nr:CBO0543 family protein [Heyndrickxia ginsengihumi]MBE6185136.1 hypothetical protein [Bacillus sp. (in: firmicutes)]MCM3025045.1 hypothetical protein [Heyndrickxia ginsengihumi]NEY20471.1 hypothetical protein [Heyndrickxia ginsengihumi]